MGSGHSSFLIPVYMAKMSIFLFVCSTSFVGEFLSDWCALSGHGT